MERPLRLFVCTFVLITGPVCLAAQVAEGVETITAADIAHHVGVIAADSMQGRDTPSPGLEATARYVADQFERVGLLPGSYLAAHVQNFGGMAGRISTWFHRYPVPVDPARLFAVFAVGDRRAVAGFTTAAYLLSNEVPKQPVKTSVLFVAGRPNLRALRNAHIDDRIVLYFPAGGTDTTTRQLVNWLAENSRSLVYLRDEDSATFAHRVQTQLMDPLLQSKEEKWVVSMLAAAVPGLEKLLATIGMNLSQLRTDTTSVIREMPSLQLSLERQRSGIEDTATTAPNVIGVLEGSDSALKNEYVVISAHMDHIGIVHGRADSIANGSDDNASGTAGLIALAKAFSQPTARPRRSMVFVATSGGAKSEFWGSRAFVAELGTLAPFGGIDVFLKVITQINLDMIGGPPQDSVTVDGLRAVGLDQAPQLLATLHPELRLTVVDGETVFGRESDHFPFTSGIMAIPALSFRNGRHEKSQQQPDAAVTMNFEQAARIVRLVFYVSQRIANVDRPPHWNAVGRREMLESR